MLRTKCSGSCCICRMNSGIVSEIKLQIILHFTHAADVPSNKRQCNKLHFYILLLLSFFFFFFFLFSECKRLLFRCNENIISCHWLKALGYTNASNKIACEIFSTITVNELLIQTRRICIKIQRENSIESVLFNTE